MSQRPRRAGRCYLTVPYQAEPSSSAAWVAMADGVGGAELGPVDEGAARAVVAVIVGAWVVVVPAPCQVDTVATTDWVATAVRAAVLVVDVPGMAVAAPEPSPVDVVAEMAAAETGVAVRVTMMAGLVEATGYPATVQAVEVLVAPAEAVVAAVTVRGAPGKCTAVGAPPASVG